jgi:poly(A) polymerase
VWRLSASCRRGFEVVIPTKTESERMPVGTAGGLPLPVGFRADQGALLVDERGDDCIRDGRTLIEAVVAAAERELHVPQRTSLAIKAGADLVRSLTAEERGRLLVALVVGSRPAACVDLATRTGLLRRLVLDIDRLRAMPKGEGRYKDVYQHTLRVIDATPPDAATRLAALLHDIAKPDTLVIEGGTARFPNHDLVGADRTARRLRALALPEDLVLAVETLVRLHLRANSYEPTWTDSAVRRLRLDAGEHWQRLLDLSNADVTSARAETVARARRRVVELAAHAEQLDRPIEVAPLDGNALMESFDRGPGRWIGDVKRYLLELVHEGRLDPEDRKAAWDAAARFVRDHANAAAPATDQ